MQITVHIQKLQSLNSQHASEVTVLQKTVASLHLQMQHCDTCSLSAAYQQEFNDYMAFKKTKKTI